MPFALALALTVGSYLLLLFVYATLFSLATQCVESAEDPLVYLSLTNKQAPTALSRTPRWHPPCRLLPQSTSKRRVWDPGIALMTTVLTWDPWRFFRWLGTFSRAAAAPNAFHRSLSPLVDACHAIQSVMIASLSPTPGLLMSTFHCCHPVLSRPTVPNINS